MLRLMKQKILIENEEMLLASRKQETPRTSSYVNIPPVVVSHVPVSVGSRSIPASTNSSISSKGDECSDNQSIRVPPVVSSQFKKRLLREVSHDSGNESFCESSVRYTTQSPSIQHHQRQSFQVTPSQSEKEPELKKQRLDQHCNFQGPVLPKMVLLARDEDVNVLSPLHVLVRSQIEVFTATPEELSQPAPGRKQPIKLNQIGLRCIHCRHLSNRQRVKRAVCYPSSVARVYHSVSDMKFDHFSNCKALPAHLRAEFEILKARGKGTGDKKSSKGCSSSTSKYYKDAAYRMGMIDGPGGVFLASMQGTDEPKLFIQTVQPLIAIKPKTESSSCLALPNGLCEPNTKNRKCDITKRDNNAVPPRQKDETNHKPSIVEVEQITMSLASVEDLKHLNPLHCFVRRHVELFTANTKDIAAPAPGRKTQVVLRQVGLRCVHCAKLPVKERVKRSVCYPPSISAIYHSVSNMKFDHFAICKGIPPEAREEFQALKAACSRRGASGNNNGKRGSSRSTAQYYEYSAAVKGLIDTDLGIFLRQHQQGVVVAQSEKKKMVQDHASDDISCMKDTEQRTAAKTPIPAGMSALMKAISQAA